jgi:hypothetical protein
MTTRKDEREDFYARVLSHKEWDPVTIRQLLFEYRAEIERQVFRLSKVSGLTSMSVMQFCEHMRDGTWHGNEYPLSTVKDDDK